MSLELDKLQNIFFSGIGGSGMSALAQLLAGGGTKVSGSDRNRDRGGNPALFARLESQNIALFPQDGSGVTDSLDAVVVSAAVEPDTPDFARAAELGIPVIVRPELLQAIVNSHRGVCFAGTSGKSTSSGLAAWVLAELGFSPNFIGGAAPVNFIGGPTTGNCLAGDSDLYVAETDESDGTVSGYTPEVGVVLNIDRDHHELDKLLPMFQAFCANTSGALALNADCPNTMRLDLSAAPAEKILFGIENDRANIRATNISLRTFGSEFTVGDTTVKNPLPGLYNVYNVLGALAAVEALGGERDRFARALPEFRGVERRFQLVGERKGVQVIDDFAHNPAKIEAVLGVFDQWPELGRLLVVFQPHGYGPTRFHRDELIETFSRCLRQRDLLILPEIYYAGGTATRDISSRELADDIRTNGRDARYFERRADILQLIASEASSSDVVLVLGARDSSLQDFAREVLESL
ncbi:MAG: UDP-N-acetylmuramate--alanine ligase [Candidatus Glassbacteria bacterium]|nr:UDP-N-acetylmuramate--alanine ligase [Candidatus Glassbacteria bacterium]